MLLHVLPSLSATKQGVQTCSNHHEIFICKKTANPLSLISNIPHKPLFCKGFALRTMRHGGCFLIHPRASNKSRHSSAGRHTRHVPVVSTNGSEGGPGRWLDPCGKQWNNEKKKPTMFRFFPDLSHIVSVFSFPWIVPPSRSKSLSWGPHNSNFTTRTVLVDVSN